MSNTNGSQGDAAKERALDLALKQIEKQFGRGSVMRLGDAPVMRIESISTGSLGLDHALGIGGLPRGRVVEIYGPESSGKTTLATHVIAEAQKMGGTCAFIDAEHAFDAAYGAKLGVQIDSLVISQPDTGEQALEICDMLIRSGAIAWRRMRSRFWRSPILRLPPVQACWVGWPWSFLKLAKPALWERPRVLSPAWLPSLRRLDLWNPYGPWSSDLAPGYFVTGQSS